VRLRLWQIACALHSSDASKEATLILSFGFLSTSRALQATCTVCRVVHVTAVGRLKHMQHSAGVGVLTTVKGDAHDIGKKMFIAATTKPRIRQISLLQASSSSRR
jgi:hypothetical protein